LRRFISSGKDTQARLLAAAKAMGSPGVSALTPSLFIDYCANRINQGISPATLNRELQTFKSLFNDLIRSGDIENNPFSSVRLIRLQQPIMQFLTIEQLQQLLADLKQSSSDAYLIALTCLATGARWREAQQLTISDISCYRVHYRYTKSKKSRSVPISKQLYQQLTDRLKQGSFHDAYSTISRHLQKLAFNLPSGERTHVLRHTFASYFIMNGGNILTLQKVLGHSSLDMTLRYAHLAPDYFQEVLYKNPLENL
jgi:site-specific recombinase XerD